MNTRTVLKQSSRESQSSPSNEMADAGERRPTRSAKWLAIGLCLIALVYALSAGLRTVGDTDVGWQMATGRWIVQHRKIPYTDVLSYTGAGKVWIYPVLSQLWYYLVFRLGGYTLLSWFSAAACVGIVAVLLRGNNVTKFLAVLAVPLIAEHVSPRAELFSHLLFAAFLVILWRYHRNGGGPLWSLPLLMFLWVNLHLGFVAGFAVFAAYLLLECGEMLYVDRRATAIKRLRAAAPWLIASVGATLLNPWGARAYVGMATLFPTQNSETHAINELAGIPFNSHTVADALLWREPRSVFWWFFFIAIAALVVSVARRRWATALILGASLFSVLHSVRFEGLFAVLVVVIGGAVLGEALETHWVPREQNKLVAGIVLLGFLSGLVGVRIHDLVTNRYYLTTPNSFSLFGPGQSRWYPEGAAAFLQSEQLRPNIFNNFNLGGFLTWRLSQYPDYVDGRGGPFGSVLTRSFELMAKPLDSAEWQQEADSRNINTVFVFLDHELGDGLPMLDTYCHSEKWRPVYLDTQAALFARVTPDSADWISRNQIDCSNVRFDSAPTGQGYRGRAERFNYYLGAASVLISLDRNAEALNALQLAERNFPGNWYLHYARAAAFQNVGNFTQAEWELRLSRELSFDENVALALDRLYGNQGRYAEQVAVLEDAVKRSAQPSLLLMRLGYAQLALGMPRQALDSFDHAERANPLGNSDAAASFRARVAEGRRLCLASLQGHDQ